MYRVPNIIYCGKKIENIELEDVYHFETEITKDNKRQFSSEMFTIGSLLRRIFHINSDTMDRKIIN